MIGFAPGRPCRRSEGRARKGATGAGRPSSGLDGEGCRPAVAKGGRSPHPTRLGHELPGPDWPGDPLPPASFRACHHLFTWVWVICLARRLAAAGLARRIIAASLVVVAREFALLSQGRAQAERKQGKRQKEFLHRYLPSYYPARRVHNVLRSWAGGHRHVYFATLTSGAQGLSKSTIARTSPPFRAPHCGRHLAAGAPVPIRLRTRPALRARLALVTRRRLGVGYRRGDTCDGEKGEGKSEDQFAHIYSPFPGQQTWFPQS
jgi:hypothetical protein